MCGHETCRSAYRHHYRDTLSAAAVSCLVPSPKVAAASVDGQLRFKGDGRQCSGDVPGQELVDAVDGMSGNPSRSSTILPLGGSPATLDPRANSEIREYFRVDPGNFPNLSRNRLHKTPLIVNSCRL
jgi:hypothetical protein